MCLSCLTAWPFLRSSALGCSQAELPTRRLPSTKSCLPAWEDGGCGWCSFLLPNLCFFHRELLFQAAFLVCASSMVLWDVPSLRARMEFSAGYLGLSMGPDTLNDC